MMLNANRKVELQDRVIDILHNAKDSLQIEDVLVKLDDTAKIELERVLGSLLSHGKIHIGSKGKLQLTKKVKQKLEDQNKDTYNKIEQRTVDKTIEDVKQHIKELENSIPVDNNEIKNHYPDLSKEKTETMAENLTKANESLLKEYKYTLERLEKGKRRMDQIENNKPEEDFIHFVTDAEVDVKNMLELNVGDVVLWSSKLMMVTNIKRLPERCDLKSLTDEDFTIEQTSYTHYYLVKRATYRKLCPTCSGTGNALKPDRSEDCNQCEGSGFVDEPFIYDKKDFSTSDEAGGQCE